MQMLREQRYPAADAPEEVLYITSPDALRRLALSFDALAADVYWMRAIQYFGGTRLSERAERRYDLLFPLLDVTTSLDPQFSIAYRFGAFFLSERPPGGPGRSDLGLRLLDKAMGANPGRWEYPYDAGFLHFRDGDYLKAAEWFQRAADTQGAPFWVRPLVAVAQTARGDTASARVVWRSLLDFPDLEFFHGEARRRLMQLDAIDQAAQLRRIVAVYTERFGHAPGRWEDMVRAGLLPGIPVDPTGVRYVLDASGGVDVDPTSRLWPLTMEFPL